MRESSLERKTRETDIQVGLNLDGTGIAKISTGVGFFDHMLTQLPVHGGLDLVLRCRGDLDVDAHHTVEDSGIALGCALKEALGDRKGITRYGTAFIPMDEALIMCCLDLGSRAYFACDLDLPKSQVGLFDAELCEEFFRALAMNGCFTLHLRQMAGTNIHHIIEATFKAFAHALRTGLQETDTAAPLSSKGIL